MQTGCTSHAGVPEVYARNHPYANGGKPYNDKIFYFGVLNMTKSFENLELDFDHRLL